MADYLPQIILELRKRGHSQPAIARFCEHWNLMLARGSEQPCPFCFGAENGILIEQAKVGGIAAFRCDQCAEQVFLKS